MKLLQWARRGEDIVHISQVERGAACGCICDACGAPLVARQGPKNSHSFAHSKSDCHGNQESILHLKAKEIIAEARKLRLRGSNGDQEVVFDQVDVEQPVGPYRVDAVGTVRAKKCYIEIAVSHQCEREKIDYFKDNELALVEITIDPHQGFLSPDQYSEYVISLATREWLSNPKQNVGAGLQPVPIDLAKIRELQERKERLEPVFLGQLRKAVGDRPNQPHYGDLEIVNLRRFGIPYENSLCVRSQELPDEYGNLAMVSWNHRELRKYLGKRVGFDIIYDYEKSLVMDADSLFPQAIIRWVSDVDSRILAREIGSRRWRRKAYSWI